MSFVNKPVPPNNVDLDSSQTLSNKTLDSSNVIDGSTVENALIETPAQSDVKQDTLANLQTYALTATDGQVCFATDIKTMYQIVDNSLTEMGSGQGGINYIENSSFEQGTEGWTGDTNLSISQETVAPLRGDGSLKIVKGAIDASGQEVTTPITVDEADLAKKLTVSFDYDFSDANYADGDMRVEITQDPAGTPTTIRVNGEDIKAGKGTHYAQFQTDATELDYELVVTQISTGTTAVTAYIDNVSVGPTSLAFGAIVEDEKDLSITTVNVAATITEATYTRTGQHMIGRVRLTMTGAATGNIAIELDDFSMSLIGTKAIGVCSGVDGTLYHNGIVVQSSSTQIQLRGDDGTGAWDAADPFEWISGDILDINFRVPIQGWSSNAQMSEDLGGRDVIFSAEGCAAVTTVSQVTKIAYTSTKDTTGSWDGDEFTVPETGAYSIDAGLRYDANASSQVLWLFIDNALVRAITREQDAAIIWSGHVTENLTKGQVISIRVQVIGDTNDDSAYSYLHIQKLASPQTILETETVAARYWTNAGQSIPNSDTTTVLFDTSAGDTHGAMDISTGEYTVSTTGWYNVSTRIRYSSLSADVAELSQLFLVVNGTNIDRAVIEYGASNSGDSNSISIVSTLFLDKGQVVKIEAHQNSGAPEPLNTSGIDNVFAIHRIK